MYLSISSLLFLFCFLFPLTAPLLDLALEIRAFLRGKITRANYDNGNLCVICGNKFSSSQQLRGHIFTHNPELQLKLKETMKSYTLHRGGQASDCNICGASFTGSSFKIRNHFVYRHLVTNECELQDWLT